MPLKSDKGSSQYRRKHANNSITYQSLILIQTDEGVTENKICEVNVIHKVTPNEWFYLILNL